MRLVLGGNPVPATVIFAPTVAAVGETVIEDDAVAALAELANRKTHSKTAVPAMKTLTAFGFHEGHLEDFIAMEAVLATINAPSILKNENRPRKSQAAPASCGREIAPPRSYTANPATTSAISTQDPTSSGILRRGSPVLVTL